MNNTYNYIRFQLCFMLETIWYEYDHPTLLMHNTFQIHRVIRVSINNMLSFNLFLSSCSYKCIYSHGLYLLNLKDNFVSCYVQELIVLEFFFLEQGIVQVHAKTNLFELDRTIWTVKFYHARFNTVVFSRPRFEPKTTG